MGFTICTIDTSANVTTIDFSGLEGLKKVAPDIIYYPNHPNNNAK